MTIEKYPEMMEAHYYAALCHLSKHSYEKADGYLSHLIEVGYGRRTVYIFAAIAAKNMGKL